MTGATIARTRDGATVEPGTVRSLTFHGARSATIPAGRVAASDPAALPVAALESLTITLFFAGSTGPSTFHEDGLTASYRAAGDHRFDGGAAAFAKQTSHSFYYLTGVDVTGGRTRNTVVTFGDSITNGHNSTVGGNDRYSDALAGRLALARRPLAVANSGISGNLLLNGLACFGEKGITRFRRDALGQPGVRTVIFARRRPTTSGTAKGIRRLRPDPADHRGPAHRRVPDADQGGTRQGRSDHRCHHPPVQGAVHVAGRLPAGGGDTGPGEPLDPHLRRSTTRWPTSPRRSPTPPTRRNSTRPTTPATSSTPTTPGTAGSRQSLS